MDKIVLDGVKYVKASVLAKEFHYTSDYVGQLCRARKVDARLVGRTWFVNPDSVVSHKKKKFLKKEQQNDQPVKLTVTEDKSDSSTKHKTCRRNVSPVVQSRTLKEVEDRVVKKVAEKRKLSVSYELDDEALLPTLIRKVTPPPRKVRIEHVGAKKLSIAERSKGKIAFNATELPEVSLSGTLQVKTYTTPEKVEQLVDTSKDTENTLKTNTISDKQDLKEAMDTETRKLSVTLKKDEIVSEKLKEQERVLKVQEKEKEEEVQIEKISTETPKIAPIVPKSEPDKEVAAVEIPVQSEALYQAEPQRVSLGLRVSPLIATFVALIVVLLLFSSSSNILVTEARYDSQITFQLANLLQLFSQ